MTVSPIPLLDLKAQFVTIESEIRGAIDRVLATQHFIMGPEVDACEREVAAYCGVAHGIGVSSGTDALLVALMALDVGPGDEVVTSPYTFFATGGVIARLGAKPVFVDIDPVTYNIDTNAIQAAITPRTRAIIPVHLFGRAADMDPILAVAEHHGLPVIEDAAQAIGAGYKGRRAGALGTIGCFSFFPSKNLGAFGDGGMVTTNDDRLAEKLRVLRVHGAKPKYHHAMIGGNFRLDALQAAVVRVKLPHLDGWSARRRANADLYGRLFGAADLSADLLTLPEVISDHVFNQYIVRTPHRDAVMAGLKSAGIGTEIYYPVPLHRQDCFSALGYSVGSLPHAEAAARETCALPIYPEMTEAMIARVAAVVISALRN